MMCHKFYNNILASHIINPLVCSLTSGGLIIDNIYDYYNTLMYAKIL